MVGGSGFSPVIRHSFVRAAPYRRPRKPRRAKNDPFSSVPGDQPAAPAMKSAHLLRLVRCPRPHPRFEQNRRRSTCGFVSAFFGMVGDRRLNVVDGPVSWRAVSGGVRNGAAAAPRRPGGPKSGGRRRCRLPRGAPRGPFRALRARSGPRGRPPGKFFQNCPCIDVRVPV